MRSGGFLLPWPSDEYMHLASTPRLHKRLYELTASAMRKEVALAHAAGFDTEAELQGVVKVLLPGDIDPARAYVDEANAAGVPIEFWSAEKTHPTFGVTHCAGCPSPRSSPPIADGSRGLEWRKGTPAERALQVLLVQDDHVVEEIAPWMRRAPHVGPAGEDRGGVRATARARLSLPGR